MPEPDLSEFLALSQPKKPACSVCTARAQLSKQEQASLDAACKTHVQRITNKAIVYWLEKRGHKVVWQMVLHHRQGNCSGLVS